MAIEFFDTTQLYQTGQLPDPVNLCELYQDNFNITTVRLHRLSDIGRTTMKAAEGSMAQGLAALGELHPEVLGNEPLLLRNDLWIPPANRHMYGFSITTQGQAFEPVATIEDLYEHDYGLAPYLTPDTTNAANFLRTEAKLKTSAVAACGVTVDTNDTLLRGWSRVAILPDNPSMTETVESLRYSIGEYCAVPPMVRDFIMDFLVDSTHGYPLERETVSYSRYPA